MPEIARIDFLNIEIMPVISKTIRSILNADILASQARRDLL